jgi:hypothetical protein
VVYHFHITNFLARSAPGYVCEGVKRGVHRPCQPSVLEWVDFALGTCSSILSSVFVPIFCDLEPVELL